MENSKKIKIGRRLAGPTENALVGSKEQSRIRFKKGDRLLVPLIVDRYPINSDGLARKILHSTATRESLNVFVIAVVRSFQTLLMT